MALRPDLKSFTYKTFFHSLELFDESRDLVKLKDEIFHAPEYPGGRCRKYNVLSAFAIYLKQVDGIEIEIPDEFTPDENVTYEWRWFVTSIIGGVNKNYNCVSLAVMHRRAIVPRSEICHRWLQAHTPRLDCPFVRMKMVHIRAS